MSKSNVTIDGVTMSIEAGRAVEAAGVNVADDVARLRSGEVTEADLLAECMDGADAAIAHDWEDYVTSVAIAAGV